MALELFPQLQRRLRSRYSSYSLLEDLLFEAERAHTRGDDAELERIYSFVEWCSRQSRTALSWAAGVAFYEHLFDRENTISRVVPWLSAYVIRRHWDLWEAWHEDRWQEIRPRLEDRLEEAEDDPGPDVKWDWNG